MKKTVAIITVNYNARQYLNGFFESISLQDHSDTEVILVDNASTDSSVTWLKENAPQAHLIVMPENVGFGEGCNIGMRYAIKELEADYLLLINNDTFLAPDLVSQLLKHTDENTVTTARIYCGGEEETLETWYAGGEIDRKTAQTKQVLYPVTESEVYEVEFISGCCMMLHRDVIARVGYFDSQYFLYYEDVDYCVRMRNAGIKMKYVTGASLWHKVGGSSLGGSETSCSTQYYVVRNRLLFADKYSQLFKGGNLSILREILEERAFFDGIENAKHRFYVQAAIADHLKGYYGRGYYGKALLEKGYYIANGFYEREDDGEKYWYWASERCSTVYLANHKKVSGIYTVSFDLAPAVDENKPILEVVINGIDKAEYSMPGHVEFDVSVSGESVVRMDLTFRGTEKTEIVDGNKRTLYYQLLNLGMSEDSRDYCVVGKMHPVERGENDYWQWSAGKGCKVYIANKELRKKVFSFQTTIESVDGKKYDLQIYVGGKRQAVVKTMDQCCIPIGMDANEIKELEMVCKAPIVSDHGRKVCFNLKNIEVKEADEELYWNECFLPEERDGANVWRWAAEDQGLMRLVNHTEETVFKKIKYTVVPGVGDTVDPFSVFLNGIFVKYGIPDREQVVIVKVTPQAVAELSIKTGYKKITDHDRTICFRIYNLAVVDVEEDFIPDGNFYEIEENENGRWCWCYAAHGTVQIVNRSDSFMWRHVGFSVLPPGQDLPGGIHIYQNGVDVTERYERDGHVNMMIGLRPKETMELRIATEWPVVRDGERDICFCVSDIVMEELEKDIFFENSFRALESDGNNTWSWSAEKKGYMTVINRQDACARYVMELEIVPYGQSEVSGKGEIVFGQSTETIEFGKRKTLFLNMAPHECRLFVFHTALPIYESDGQVYCFQVRNAKLNALQSGVYFSDGFYEEESAGENHWRWCSEDQGNLYIVNAGDAERNIQLNLELMDLEGQRAEFEVWQGQKYLLSGICGKKYGIQLIAQAQSIEEVKIICHTDRKCIDGRALCFGIRNLEMILE